MASDSVVTKRDKACKCHVQAPPKEGFDHLMRLLSNLDRSQHYFWRLRVQTSIVNRASARISLSMDLKANAKQRTLLEFGFTCTQKGGPRASPHIQQQTQKVAPSTSIASTGDVINKSYTVLHQLREPDDDPIAIDENYTVEGMSAHTKLHNANRQAWIVALDRHPEPGLPGHVCPRTVEMYGDHDEYLK